MTSAGEAPRHRLLIVDDEDATRLLLARILTIDMQVEVTLAGTSLAAMIRAQIASRSRPHP